MSTPNSYIPVTKEKLLSVQALRGIAALLVVLFHIDAMFRGGGPWSRAAGEFWGRGFAGVDLFFVISGFIMVYVSRDIAPSLKSAGRFLYDRVTRIYPLWWVFAGLMMVYFYTAYGSPAAPDKAAGDAIPAYIAKSLLLLPQTEDPVLGVGWTLIYEMQFYLLFAIGLLFARKWLPIWIGIWSAVILVGSLIWAQPLHAGNLAQLFISPLNIEFILGALVALYVSRGPLKNGAIWLGLGAIGFAAALLFFPDNKIIPFNWTRVVCFGIPGALIILGVVTLEREGRLRVPSPLVKIGDWSYSLYLSHLLVLLSLTRIWNMQLVSPYIPEPLKWGAEGWLDNIAYIILGIFGSLIVAGLSYHLIERTSLKLLRRRNRNP